MIRDIEKLSKDQFDLLIIGGGIHGATIAWLASQFGLYTALIEKRDFSQGSSSNSQKIIHGGLRYLQQLDFQRIRQSVYERKRLMWLAPHLIHPLKCVMPIYGFGAKGKEIMTIGLKMYDFISSNRNELNDTSKRMPNCRILSKDELKKYIPDIENKNLRGGALWYDGYCYNTERLVISFLQSADYNGAIIANYVRALNLIVSNKRLTGVEVQDELKNDKFDIKAKMVVNCTGNPLQRNEDFPLNIQKKIAGINVIVRKLFPTTTAVGLQSKDSTNSRLYFVLPWRGKSILGTEWFPFDENKNEFIVHRDHCTQLIEKFNKTYTSAKLKLEDITFIHKGVVPGNSSNPNDISTLKNFHIIDDRQHGIQGLFHVLGIKYTTAVYVAEQTMNKILPSFKPKTLFDQSRLVAGDIENFNDFKNALIKKWEKQFDSIQIERMVLNYGRQAEVFLEKSAGDATKKQGFDINKLLEQEVLNAVQEEMAIKLSDTILRRTDIGTAEKPGERDIELISKIMAKQLNWNDRQRYKEIEELKKFYPQFDIH